MKPKERMDKDGSWRRQTNYAEWCSTDDEGKTMEPSEVGGEWCPTFITLAPWVTDWSDPEKRTLSLFSTSHFAREEPRLHRSSPEGQMTNALMHGDILDVQPSQVSASLLAQVSLLSNFRTILDRSLCVPWTLADAVPRVLRRLSFSVPVSVFVRGATTSEFCSSR